MLAKNCKCILTCGTDIYLCCTIPPRDWQVLKSFDIDSLEIDIEKYIILGIIRVTGDIDKYLDNNLSLLLYKGKQRPRAWRTWDTLNWFWKATSLIIATAVRKNNIFKENSKLKGEIILKILVLLELCTCILSHMMWVIIRNTKLQSEANT